MVIDQQQITTFSPTHMKLFTKSNTLKITITISSHPTILIFASKPVQIAKTHSTIFKIQQRNSLRSTCKSKNGDKEHNRPGMGGITILRQELIQEAQSPTHPVPMPTKLPDNIGILIPQTLLHYISTPLHQLHAHLRRGLQELLHLILEALSLQFPNPIFILHRLHLHYLTLSNSLSLIPTPMPTFLQGM